MKGTVGVENQSSITHIRHRRGVDRETVSIEIVIVLENVIDAEDTGESGVFSSRKRVVARGRGIVDGRDIEGDGCAIRAAVAITDGVIESGRRAVIVRCRRESNRAITVEHDGSVAGITHGGNRQAIAIEIGVIRCYNISNTERDCGVFSRGNGVVNGYGRVVDCGNGDGDRSAISQATRIGDGVVDRVGAVEIGVRGVVDRSVRVDGDRSIVGRGNPGERNGIAIEITVVTENIEVRDRGVLVRRSGVIDGLGRIIDRTER